MKKNGKTKDQDVIVTQEELKELVELEKEKKKEIKLRDSIRNRVLKGAKVEPGKLKVYIETKPRIQLTCDSIRKLFGTMGEDVLAALPTRRTDLMYVRPGKKPKEQDEPKAVVDPSKMGRRFEPGHESDLLRLFIDAISPIENPESNEFNEDEILVDLSESEIKLGGSITFPESDYGGKKKVLP